MAGSVIELTDATFDKTVNNSAAYIQSWLGALKNDKRMVVVAAGAAQKRDEGRRRGGGARHDIQLIHSIAGVEG